MLLAKIVVCKLSRSTTKNYQKVYLPVSNLSQLMLMQVLASYYSLGKLTLAHNLRPYL